MGGFLKKLLKYTWNPDPVFNTAQYINEQNGKSKEQAAAEMAAQAAASAEAQKAARVAADGERLVKQRAEEADARAQAEATSKMQKDTLRAEQLALYRAQKNAGATPAVGGNGQEASMPRAPQTILSEQAAQAAAGSPAFGTLDPLTPGGRLNGQSLNSLLAARAAASAKK